MPELAQNGNLTPSVVILDLPRKGCEAQAVNAIAKNRRKEDRVCILQPRDPRPDFCRSC